MKSKKITAVILAKDEAHRLPLIFENLKNFCESIVFDGGSTDGTQQVCQRYGAVFVERPPEAGLVVSGDIKFAYSYVKTPYVLFINCSHYYPQRLLEEFKRVANDEIYHAVYHDVLTYSYARVVHRPFFRRRSSATSFFRLDAVNFSRSILHNETPVVISENLKLKLPAKDEYSIHLFRDYDVKKAEENHSKYSSIDAKHRIEMGMRTNTRRLILKPLKHFFHQYIRCGSILYGVEGLIYSLLFAQLELNVQLKMWEIQSGHNIDSIRKKNIEIRRELLEQDY